MAKVSDYDYIVFMVEAFNTLCDAVVDYLKELLKLTCLNHPDLSHRVTAGSNIDCLTKRPHMIGGCFYATLE